MCTSISYRNKDHYFGRNLDLEFCFWEQVVITPRAYSFPLKNGALFQNRFALIGMATVMDEYPLYYEAANERGLAMAGLYFPKSGRYQEPKEGMENITPFELLPWILGQASSVREARALLERVNLTNVPFSQELPLSPLHFMLSDREGSLVAEPREDGLHLFENPYDVMSNEPPFDYHMWNMQQYLNLSAENQPNRFSARYPLENYAVGMGALGLPGDVSSASRFVRAAFNLANSFSEEREEDNVTQFFHVLDSVAMVKGASLTESGERDITRYTSCINTDKGIYYYKTYDNSQITALRMDRVDLDGAHLFAYDLNDTQQIRYDN